MILGVLQHFILFSDSDRPFPEPHSLFKDLVSLGGPENVCRKRLNNPFT